MAPIFIPGNEFFVEEANKAYDSLQSDSRNCNNISIGIMIPPVYLQEENVNCPEIEVSDDICVALNNIKTKALNNIMIGLLNVNSLSGKFDILKTVISGKIDVMTIVETKLDDSYPTSQFLMNGYSKPFRLDRDKHGGGILLCVREDIPCKILERHTLPCDIEGIFVELNFKKSKLLLLATYHPPNQPDKYYFNSIGNALENYIMNYDKLILAGDFNAQEKEVIMSNFLGTYGLNSLVKENTCFKSIHNPSSIDLFLTNSKKSFQNTAVLSTGLSDCHKLVLTVLKTTFPKVKSREIFYRSYKNFSEINFRQHLVYAINENRRLATSDFFHFQEIFRMVLDRHAPIKKKFLRANEVPYMTKELKKAIMNRSRFENRYYKSKSFEDKVNYKKQKNYCNRLFKRERKNYYNNLDLKNITDNKKFWATLKPFLTDKGLRSNSICLIEENEIISKDCEVADTLNIFFKNSVSSLLISGPSECITDIDSTSDNIDSILLKFQNHPSILMIKEKMDHSIFSFNITCLTEVVKEVNALNINKSNPQNSISASHIKQYIDICGEVLLEIINKSIINSEFEDAMKLADITPVNKNADVTNKSNYRPISGLPSLSKLFEKIIQSQISVYIEKFLSPFLCGYRKGYNVQHALVTLIEKWRISLDKGGFAGGILMDLSKAFDTLNHDLLIAKLSAYGFDKTSLKLIKSYLTNRWQRTKINNSYSSWTEIMHGVPQGSILGPLLFNIYLNDLLFLPLDTSLCNYADDNTLYACDISLNNLIDKLESSASLVLNWFKYNYMKPNDSKCHLLVSGNKEEVIVAKIGEAIIIESHEVKLLGTKIDRELNFNSHMTTVCKKAGKKINALARLCKILPLQKRRILMNAFFMSQFSFCPLLFMFCDRTVNYKINSLHYRALRIVYMDDVSNFDELLKRDKSVKVHHKNIQFLATEMFKVKLGFAPQFMNDIFKKRNISDDTMLSKLRNPSEFYNFENPRSVRYGTETLRSLGPKIWNIVPDNIKDSGNLKIFKIKIKSWIPTDCPCRLCKLYLPGLGFYT